ncbi:MAG TPA: hypothetical protein VK146_16600 [Tabrizicola sp.]|nr:hypothetical protein [Tabrizicola sp.]
MTAAFSPCAGLAQDGGVALVFGIENRLEVVGNDALSVPADGTDIANVTRLSFGLTSETALDQLSFFVAGAAVVENPAGPAGTELDFGRGEASFSYRREVPSAAFEITGEVRSDDIDSADSLDAVDETGSYTDYALSTRLETGRTSTVGLQFGLGYAATDYQDTTDPDLVDFREARADATVLLRFSETLTARLGARYSERREDDAGTTVTETTVGFVGLDYAVSERLDLTTELGYAQVETEEFDLIERETGPDLTLGATYDMPVGTLSGLFRVTRSVDEGQRETLEIARAIETPRDEITARLGVTRADVTGTDVIGSLSLTRALPDGSIGLELARTVAYDGDDAEETDTSAVSVNWLKNLNESASISLDISYEQSDSPSETIKQVTFGAGYSQRLTADWNLDTGVGYRIRDDNDGRARSPNLFVALSRDFQIRP